ncbi:MULTISPECIES: DUF7522 family protein [Haloferax]|uniref:Uncharacterized protein n=3 Tax=Haloferax TaxID=2251 RepID=A0A0D6JNG2_9EURY|nr:MULTISPECIES: hypothetical protein [Haloferax]EMA04981.1 hypothetical protein C438_11748 [Haloferax denitrificans ATCC 35960]GGC44743.1 hypothetical protein GCM10007209_03030 [Haloferax sulfurifontis]CQR49389.1 hypothetical protein BN996_00850 [Haloferax massiliensis]
MTESTPTITQSVADAIVSTCRTTLGDSLRSVVHFTRDDFDVLYVRRDLYDGDEAAARAAKSELVENERTGFGPRETYSAGTTGATPDFGEYEFTLRVFSDGFVGRVVGGDRGVIVTTDELELSEFEEMEVALRRMLESTPGV